MTVHKATISHIEDDCSGSRLHFLSVDDPFTLNGFDCESDILVKSIYFSKISLLCSPSLNVNEQQEFISFNSFLQSCTSLVRNFSILFMCRLR